MHSTVVDESINEREDDSSSRNGSDDLNEFSAATISEKKEEMKQETSEDEDRNELEITGQAATEKVHFDQQETEGEEPSNLDAAESAKQHGGVQNRRHFFDVSIVNTAQIETDVDTPDSSSDENETINNSGSGSPENEIRSERRFPPIGCSSEDPASSGSASDDLEKGCYDSLEEDSGSCPPKQRIGGKEVPKRRRTLPPVPPDFSEQQKRAFESLLVPQQLPPYAVPSNYVQPTPASFYVPHNGGKPYGGYQRQPQPVAQDSYYEDPWQDRVNPYGVDVKQASRPHLQPDPPIQQKVNLERSRTFNLSQDAGPRRRRELPQVPRPSAELISQVDSPDEYSSLSRPVELEVVPQREYRGNPPVPRWAHQGAGGFLQFSGEEDSGCASLDRTSVSPQQPQPQQPPAGEEDREPCSFMWFDMTPAPKKPAPEMRRQKKMVSSATAKRLAMNRHSAPPGSLETSLRRQSTKDVPNPTAELKRRKSSTTLSTNVAERRKPSQSMLTALNISAVLLKATQTILF